MRTVLALATAVLLFAPGCGDTTTTPDMPVSTVMDMATPAVGPDMTASCKSILTCAQGCLAQANVQTCVAACNAKGGAVAMQQFGALEQCLFMYCAVDAGTGIVGCITKAIQDPNMCMTQYGACK